MRIKSYFTNTVESAVALARIELGSEALLISVRQTGPENKALGRYEVVFGLAAPEKIDPVPSGPAAVALPSESPFLPEREDNINQRTDETRRFISAPPQERTELRSTVQLSAPYRALVEARVDRTLAEEIAGSFQARMTKETNRRAGIGPVRVPSRKEVHEALVAEMEARFEVALSPFQKPDAPCVATLVGPLGAGKTTTLIKLAIIKGLAAGRPVDIVSLDTQRVGATEALRSYAAVLQIGFYPLYNPALLPHAIQDLSDRNALILIDTPGCRPDDKSTAALAKALFRCPEIETHLVVSATTSDHELRRAIDQFAILQPASLIVTRMDEAVGFGRILTEAARTMTPLSFFGSGPEIPEDLETATKRGLVDRIVGRYREQGLSAA